MKLTVKTFINLKTAINLTLSSVQLTNETFTALVRDAVNDKTLTDHTGGTKDADLQFFGHDDLYDLWVSMDYLRRTAVMRVAVKQCNCTKHAEQRQWSSQMVAAQ